MSYIKAFIAIFMLLTAGLFGYEWQTITNTNSISGIAASNSSYWASTSGGVLNFAPASGSIIKYVNTDGLGGIEINTCASGNLGIWFGSADGKLTFYNEGRREWEQFLILDRDGSPLTLNNIYSNGSYLWISSNIGVSLFDTERHGGEIRETYRRFGNIPQGTPANCVIIGDDRIWVATQRGVACARRDDANLLDFTHWLSGNSDELPELPTDRFLGIFEYQNSIWGVLPDNIVRVAVVEGIIVSEEIIEIPASISGYAATEDTVYLGCAGGRLFAWSNSTLSELALPSGPDSAITSIYPDPVYGLLLGSAGEGIFYQRNGEPVNLRTSGPLNNSVVDMTSTSDGKIYLVHSHGALSVYDDGTWSSITLPLSSLISIRADSLDNIWVGTFGQGILKYTPGQQIQIYNQENSSLIGNNDDLPGSLDFIVVPDMHFDSHGLAWFACYRGHVKRPISFYDPGQERWEYYDYYGFAQEAKITAVYSDGAALWAGFEDAGLYRISYGADPFDKTGLAFKQYTRDSLLPSENVQVITADNKGTIFVGTDRGLAQKKSEDRFFSGLLLPEGIGPQITSLAFDLRNNIWVGTQTGLAYRPAGETSFTAFTSGTSELISDNIAALVIDSQRRLWVASKAGVSVVSYDAGVVAEEVDQVFAYPNPFVVTDAGEKVLFNYLGEAEVNVFTLDGRRLATVLSNVGWDGTNQNGEKVSSGIYLFLIRDNQGNTHTGKIALIRK